MFDLDKAIVSYLGQLNDKRLVSRECLDEIESHLRDQIDFYITEGDPPQIAFEKSIIAVGSPKDLLNEFSLLVTGNRQGQIANVLSHYFDRRVVMRLFIGLFLGVFFILAGLCLEGGNLHQMLQPTPFIIVVGGALGALLITYPVKMVRDSIVLALTGRQAVRASYLDAANVFRSFGDLAVLSSFIGVIFGVIHVLSNLAVVERLGAGCAVAIVSLLYGVLAKLFIGRALSDSFKSRAYPSAEWLRS